MDIKEYADALKSITERVNILAKGLDENHPDSVKEAVNNAVPHALTQAVMGITIQYLLDGIEENADKK